MTTTEDVEKNGGPAYPTIIDSPFNVVKGMSLRDWFAGQAMAAHLQNLGDHFHGSEQECNRCRADTARRSYAIADAMLAARTPSPMPANAAKGESGVGT